MIYNIKCKHCQRFLGTTEKSITVDLKCSNSRCKKIETYKIEFMSDHINDIWSGGNCDILKKSSLKNIKERTK